MAKEIERKFLVKSSEYRRFATSARIEQGYISQQKERVVRVRIYNQQAFITLKGKNVGCVRDEFEYEIPITDAQQIIDNLCLKPVIKKVRYTLTFADGHTWEIDEFEGDNEGLVVAEIELKTEDEQFELPGWLGEEVTNDARYYNLSLMTNPYKNWKKINQ